MIKRLIVLFVVLVCAPAAPARTGAAAVTRDQLPAGTVGQPWAGAAGLTRTVAEIEALDARIGPVAKGRIIDLEERELEPPERDDLPLNPDSPRVASWPASPGEKVVAPGGDNLSVGTSFLGAQIGESGFIPPDTMGAVGPSQVLVIVNGRIKVFEKNGQLGALDATTDAFFDSVRGSAYTSDPRVRFDRTSNRWFVTIITVGFPNRVLIAVSDGPTIVSTSSFTFFQFQQDAVGSTPNGDTGALADYATLGIDRNALYIGANMFTRSSYLGSTVWVVRKSSVLGQGPIVVTAFRRVADIDHPGVDTPQGVSNDDPDATEGYFIGVDIQRFGVLNMLRIMDPGGTPVLQNHIEVTVPSTYVPRPIRPLGSGMPVDASNDRLFAAHIYEDAYTHERTLWTAHTITVTRDGVGSSGGDRNGCRWYQIGNLTGQPALVQAGTVFDSANTTSPTSYLFPTIAMSGQGSVVLGCTSAGESERAGVAIATRLPGDPLGTIRAAQIVQPGSGNYNVQTENTQRWGDYSFTCVDPADGMTLWTFQEYCNGDNSWAARVVSFKPPPPPARILSVMPSSIGIGRTTTVTVEGAADGDGAFFDPGASYPKRLTAFFSGPGIAVTGVRAVDPTHVELTLDVAADAPTGGRNLTITNPDGQSVSGTNVLSVGPAIDSVQFKKTANGNGKLLIDGVGFTSSVAVFVDGVAFQKAAKVTTNSAILQKGKLSDGRKLSKAIRRGQTVTISVANNTGGVAVIQYTRP